MIPMPVLYGVFLYMGISSLNGIQFMHRIILVFMPEKHQPDFIFLRHVRTYRVHIFTFIQLSTIALLFLIKSNKQISITFPIMVLALVIIRKGMDYVFTQKELSYLDDIMPEIVKRKIDDQSKDGGESKLSIETPKPKQPIDEINISTELANTGIWKDLVKDNEKDYRKKLGFRRLTRRGSSKRTKSGQSNQSNEVQYVEIPLLTNTDNNDQTNTTPKIPSIIINSTSGNK